MYNKSKFVVAEIFSNSDGKTSESAVAGILLVIIASMSFISTMVGYFIGLSNTIEVMSKIIELALFGGTLLGVRKVMGGINNNKQNNVDNSIEVVEEPIK